MRLIIILALAAALQSADSLFPQSLATHTVALASVPTSPTDLYTTSVWLKSIEFIPQSTTSPTCTVTDKAGNTAYNAIPLSTNHSYRDERSDTSPLFMSGGITWSCSDSTVKAQVIVKY